MPSEEIVFASEYLEIIFAIELEPEPKKRNKLVLKLLDWADENELDTKTWTELIKAKNRAFERAIEKFGK